VFAWFYKNMPGVGWNIAEHKTPLYLDNKPVKQKLRRMKLEWALKLNEEFQKQLDIGFIRVT